ncbi:hypothetical protein BU16DRAFT_541384 [Lophium mytilinum]|uniref:Uncharacterized protein n=1 Tax=Lophium mytilinum TaxID=390894 RepID=A0A6A6QJL8_9PEZI|nr:hypothetical protein BU16DRAFT_541384 [Lophium mytilinum]
MASLDHHQAMCEMERQSREEPSLERPSHSDRNGDGEHQKAFKRNGVPNHLDQQQSGKTTLSGKVLYPSLSRRTEPPTTSLHQNACRDGPPGGGCRRYTPVTNFQITCTNLRDQLANDPPLGQALQSIQAPALSPPGGSQDSQEQPSSTHDLYNDHRNTPDSDSKNHPFNRSTVQGARHSVGSYGVDRTSLQNSKDDSGTRR